ncbi:MAG: hypothetical protein [Caudoviricetes sp.]|nr:MAG: hypothetical protein [Caudoviricetes sp.]
MICLSGKKRSGKDTAAAFMREMGFKTYALADPIKESLLRAFEMHNIEMTLDMLNGVDYDREIVLDLNTNQVRMILIDAVLHELSKQEICHEIYAKHLQSVYNVIKEQMAPFSVRKFMQVFGTDIMCNCVSNEHWLSYTKHMSDGVVITDVRQPWEEEYFRKRNSDFVFIIGKYKEYKETNDRHITERGLTPQENDILIENHTLEQLRKEIKCLLKPKLMS